MILILVMNCMSMAMHYATEGYQASIPSGAIHDLNMFTGGGVAKWLRNLCTLNFPFLVFQQTYRHGEEGG